MKKIFFSFIFFLIISYHFHLFAETRFYWSPQQGKSVIGTTKSDGTISTKDIEIDSLSTNNGNFTGLDRAVDQLKTAEKNIPDSSQLAESRSNSNIQNNKGSSSEIRRTSPNPQASYNNTGEARKSGKTGKHGINISDFIDENGNVREYLHDPNHPDAKYLSQYGREWIYTAALALQAAIGEGDLPTATKIAENMNQHVVRDSKTGQPLGWHFSRNTKDDNFKDPRLVTGANAWTTRALGAYTGSPEFQAAYQKDPQTYKKYVELYKESLSSLSSLKDNTTGLYIAGYTTPQLANIQKQMKQVKPGTSNYNELVKKYNNAVGAEGYRSEDDFVKSHEFITEHQLDMINVQNGAINHPLLSGTEKQQYKKERSNLRDNIMQKLGGKDSPDGLWHLTTGYDPKTGRSKYDAIDNQAWMAAMMLSYGSPLLIPEDHQDKYRQALEYAHQNYITKKTVSGLALKHGQKRDIASSNSDPYNYNLAHYLDPEYNDPYYAANTKYGEIVHLEGSRSMQMGLEAYNKYVKPDESFERKALMIESELDRFTSNFGYPYASENIKDHSTTLDSLTSFVWTNYDVLKILFTSQ